MTIFTGVFTMIHIQTVALLRTTINPNNDILLRAASNVDPETLSQYLTHAVSGESFFDSLYCLHINRSVFLQYSAHVIYFVVDDDVCTNGL